VHSSHATWTYAALADRADRIAAVLVHDLGLRPGERVLLRAPNCPMLLASWLGVVKAGGVVVATMPLLRAAELVTIGRKARVRLALCDARLADELEAARAGIPSLEQVVHFQAEGRLETLMEARPGPFHPVDTAADDPCMIAFTSGTTGVPKGTVHFHRDVLAVCDTFSRRVLRPGPADRFLGSPPLALTFGLGALALFPLRARASTVLVEQPTPANLLEAARRHHATVLFTAPTAYRGLLAEIGDAGPGTLRACVSAGEPLPLSTFQAWEAATGIRMIDGIGTTEMLHIFVAAAGDDIRPGATGRPVPGYEATVLDEEGQPLREGLGRLAVRGPTGCRYLDDDRQQAYVQNGWNVTGDTYRLDGDGYFDDMIISAGYNIAGPEVEDALLSHPEVLECAVVGSPDERRGNVVKAFVVLIGGASGDDALVASLQDHVKARIAPYKYPREVEFVDRLPRTETGKVQRYKLREREARRGNAR
jgi:2-aminobenzoate-CoA ligase